MSLLAALRHGLFPPPGYFRYLCGDFDFTMASGEGTNDEGSLAGTFQDYKSQKSNAMGKIKVTVRTSVRTTVRTSVRVRRG